MILIDNYDSFTYNLVHQLWRCAPALRGELKVIRNDDLSASEIARSRPRALVISPGPGSPRSAGACLEAIEKLAGKCPILGVCLGHQAIAEAFGARITRAPRAIHGKECLVRHCGAGLFEGVPDPLQVGRYHSLAIEPGSLNSRFEVTARSDDGVIMGISSASDRMHGVQFHPESFLTIGGDTLIKNFLCECGFECAP